MCNAVAECPVPVDGVVADLHALIAKEKIAGAAVVGHSMGGLAALMLAEAHPGDAGKLMIVDSLPFIGTLFAPTQDRDEPGRGFTHKVGDTVAIATPRLGRLVNRVVHSKDAPAWEFGIGALIRNLAARGLWQ